MLISRRYGSALLYVIGILEGIRVTLTPAFSQQLTSGEGFQFSNSEYGLLFIPFSFASLIVSFLVGKWIEKKGLANPFLVAIVADLLSLYFIGMAFVLSFSTFSSFVCILIALFLSGIGFGILLPVVTTELCLLYPHKTNIPLILFYLSLSVGSLILFLVKDFFLQHGAFSLLFISVGFILTFIAINFFDIFSKHYTKHTLLASKKLLWTLVVAMVLDGILENVFFNWTLLYAREIKAFSEAKVDNLYLGFLVFFSLGQILYVGLLRRISLSRLVILAPACLALVAFFASFVFNESSSLTFFCLIGLFLCANLPLLMCFCRKMFGVQPVFFGLLIAAYTLGYGIASFGFIVVEVTKDSFILGSFFEITTLIAFLIAFLNYLSVKHQSIARLSQ